MSHPQVYKMGVIVLPMCFKKKKNQLPQNGNGGGFVRNGGDCVGPQHAHAKRPNGKRKGKPIKLN